MIKMVAPASRVQGLLGGDWLGATRGEGGEFLLEEVGQGVGFGLRFRLRKGEFKSWFIHKLFGLCKSVGGRMCADTR